MHHTSQRYTLTYGDLEEEPNIHFKVGVLALATLMAFIQKKKKKNQTTMSKARCDYQVDWTSDHHLSVFSIWKNQSKQWNVEMADKLWNKWTSAASGHKKKG